MYVYFVLRMKKLSILCFCLVTAFFAKAQDPKEEVMDVVKKLFVAMETNNGDLASGLFTIDAELRSVVFTKGGYGRVSSIPLSKLIEVFSEEKEVIYSEPFWNERVLIDSSYAVVWVDYAFYLGADFSHCGVDMFQMVKLESGWKIFGLTDTRKKNDCEVPESIRVKYEK